MGPEHRDTLEAEGDEPEGDSEHDDRPHDPQAQEPGSGNGPRTPRQQRAADAQAHVEQAAKRKWGRGLGNRRHKSPSDDVHAKERLERQEKVWEMRAVQALSLHEIERRTGIPRTTVKRDIEAMLRLNPPPNVEAVRAEENTRLEKNRERLETLTRMLQQKFFGKEARDADGNLVIDKQSMIDAATTIAKIDKGMTAISASRRRLHGADAPERREHAGPNGGPIPVATARASLSELLEISDANAEDVGGVSRETTGGEPGEDAT